MRRGRRARAAFDGEVLTTPDGLPVNAIWRRSVTNDVLGLLGRLAGTIDAVRARKVALIGAFSGHIVHDKQLFEVLFAPETQAFLTEEEIAFVEETVPMTAFLNDDQVNIDQIRANREEWIIKPTDHYGADNVYAGCEVSQEEWERVIDEFAERARRLPLHCAALHPPLQDRHAAAATRRHQRGARRRRGKRAGTLQQSERAVPVQRPLPRCLQPAGAASDDFEDQRRHDRGHYLGLIAGRARWAGAVDGIR